MATLFLVSEPLRGCRAGRVSQPRTRLDVAHWIKPCIIPCNMDLVDVRDPQAKQIVLVLGQLITHASASRYAAFPLAEAQRLTDKQEIHHTPKHGRRLNMAEVELAVLQGQCLAQRLPDESAMQRAVGARAERRNATAADARIKLQRLYPAFDA